MTIDQLIEEEVHAKIDLRLKFNQTLITNSTLYFNSCDYKWMPLFNSIVLDGVEMMFDKSDRAGFDYMVNDYVSVDLPTTIKLKNFYLYEGTANDVTDVFSKKSNLTREKLPMMWLSFNPLPTISGSVGSSSPYPYNIRFTLFLTGATDYANRHTKQHMREVVAHLDEYADAIVRAIEVNGVFSQTFDWTKQQLPWFGRLDSKGFVENILDGTEMSAIQLDIDVSTSKKCKC